MIETTLTNGLSILNPSGAIDAQMEEARTFAPHVKIPILITGETGTGKDGMAQYIHKESKLHGSLVICNIAGLPGELIESEMFGHKKGAFTGADSDRVGRFGAANGGTIFLDEIGDLPLAAQAKLLRVLESGEYNRVGSNETLHTSARVIAATNKDLAAEIEAGRFRADLYHRLNHVEITMPPLRERPDDIVPLTGHFMAAAQREYALDKKPRLSDEGRDKLQNYNWPGNIRQLKSTVQTACVRAQNNNGLVMPEMLHLDKSPVSFRKVESTGLVVQATTDFAAQAKINLAERENIFAHLSTRKLLPPNGAGETDFVTWLRQQPENMHAAHVLDAFIRKSTKSHTALSDKTTSRATIRLALEGHTSAIDTCVSELFQPLDLNPADICQSFDTQ